MKILKKFKMLASALLAMSLLCSAAVPVIAAEQPPNDTDTVDIDARMSELNSYNEWCAIKCYARVPEPGEAYLKYTDESREIMRPVVAEVDELLYAYYNVYPRKIVVTEEMIDEKMEKLRLADEAMCVDRSELRLLLEFCGNEKNDDNYYSDEVWNNFKTCFENADMAISEKADDVTASAAYWDLFSAYNKLCTSNQVYGDVNGDGVTNVKDATEIQMYAVEAISFNSSQKYVAAFTHYWNIDVNVRIEINVGDATAIMKYVVGEYNNDKTCSQLKYLTPKVDAKDWRVNTLYVQEKKKHVYDFDIYMDEE